MTSGNIQHLNDEQLDGIVGGGSPLPAAFDAYMYVKGDKRALKIGSATGSSVGTTMVYDDTDKVAGYLNRLEKQGITQVALYPGSGDTPVIFSIDQLRSMLG